MSEERVPFFGHVRSSGSLLHVTSLPGSRGCGTLGAPARHFLSFLAEAGQSVWQVLPLVRPGAGFCPYSSTAGIGGNPLLVSLDDLLERSLLERDELSFPPSLAVRGSVPVAAYERFHLGRMKRAAARNASDASGRATLEAWGEREPWALDDALFHVARRVHGKDWTQWPAALRRRDARALERFRREHRAAIDVELFSQWCFDEQWSEVKAEARRLGIRLLGDLPIFVAHQSVDCWKRPDLFHLDRGFRPTRRSGVPPDAFSSKGQLWGHPHYRWEVSAAEGHAWWLERLRYLERRFDAVRLDHFLGFFRAWAIPKGARTARGGRWEEGPGAAFLEVVRREVPDLELVAEDLGIETQEANAALERFQLPGMRVMQFGFQGGHAHEPHRFARRSVAYTGTHDNDTVVGWFRKLSPDARANVLRYVGGELTAIHENFLRALLTSPANTVIHPIQDLLGLGSEARLNVPGRSRGNWIWRLDESLLTSEVAARLRALTSSCERLVASSASSLEELDRSPRGSRRPAAALGSSSNGHRKGKRS